jgi:hypothetical protein
MESASAAVPTNRDGERLYFRGSRMAATVPPGVNRRSAHTVGKGCWPANCRASFVNTSGLLLSRADPSCGWSLQIILLQVCSNVKRPPRARGDFVFDAAA